jgi:hypothetical protein
MGLFLEERYYIIYTWLNKPENLTIVIDTTTALLGVLVTIVRAFYNSCSINPPGSRPARRVSL